MTTVADLTVGPPGKPDQPPASSPSPRGERPAAAVVVPDEVIDQGPPPVSHESVKGLILGAANILHQVLAARYEERPDIGVMTDDEADRIASALVSMSSRNPVLADFLARSDVATMAIVLAGYGGRVANDIREARRERRETDERAVATARPRDARPAGAVGTPMGGIPGGAGNGPGHDGGLRAAHGGGLA